ncbi:hypothetical protein ES703_116019 [subsurface metagenome]
MAAGGRHQQGGGGHYRLAAAHLPLQQAAHRLWFGQVSQYLTEHPVLGRG